MVGGDVAAADGALQMAGAFVGRETFRARRSGGVLPLWEIPSRTHHVEAAVALA